MLDLEKFETAKCKDCGCTEECMETIYCDKDIENAYNMGRTDFVDETWEPTLDELKDACISQPDKENWAKLKLKIQEDTLREFLSRCEEVITENRKIDEYNTALSYMELFDIKKTVLAE